MSFSDFKEVEINDPGTAAFYGADDTLEVMKILNGKIVSNRQVKINNPWVWRDSFDILAAATTPGNPAANSKRLYVEPSNNHLMVKSTAGTIIDIDVLGAAPTGEANTATNVGAGGQGLFKQKTSANLEFRNINAASPKITVALDTPNNEVDLDVSEANLTLNNVGGVLNVSKGGTGLSTITSNALLKGNGTGNINLITAGTDGHILTMVSGQPSWAVAGAAADTKVILFEAGTQVGTVGRRVNLSVDDDFNITENAGSDRFDISLKRSEVMVGRWDEPAGFTKTNIGTTYIDLFDATTDGLGTDVDGTGKNDFRFYVTWSKNFGSGTHDIRIKDQTTSDILATITNMSSGRNVVTGAIPSFFQENVRSIKLQAKSSVSTDDPIFRGASLYYK